MKQISKILKLVPALFAVGSLITGCGDDTWQPESIKKDGTLDLKSLNVGVSDNLITIETTSRAESDKKADINVNTFNVYIKNNQGTVVNQWTYGTMPEIITLKEGDYTLSVESHTVQKAEWDRPYYKGEKSFKITADKVTAIGELVCKFASIKVTIGYSDLLKKYMEDDCRVTVVCNDVGSLEFNPKESKAGYFEALEGSSTLVATFKGSVNGSQALQRVALNDVVGGTHRLIVFKLTPASEEKGYLVVDDGITIDYEIFDQQGNGTIDIEEDIIGGDNRPGHEDDDEDDPSENTITITSQTLSFDTPMNPLDFGNPDENPELKKAIVNISAPKGIKNLNVTISSTSEDFIDVLADEAVDVPTQFDLSNPVVNGKDYSEKFKTQFGFPVGNDVKNQTTVVFDITQFVPLLRLYDGTHTFTLETVDNTGKKLKKNLVFIYPFTSNTVLK